MVKLETRIKNKQLIKQHKTKCMICGIEEPCVLELHHMYDKKFNISQEAHYIPYYLFKKELDKCVCLCSNHHKMLHTGILNINNNEL